MSEGRRFLTRSGLSVASQVLLSATNLLIGLCLIRLGSKESYGLYAQLFAGGIFAVALLDSVFGSPLTTLASGMSAAVRQHVIAQIRRSQRIAGAALGAFLGVAVGSGLAYFQVHTHPALVGTAFGLLVFTSALREYQRTVWFIELQVGRVVRLDALFSTVALLGAGLIVWLNLVDVLYVLCVLAVANSVGILARPGGATHTVPEVREEALPDLRSSLSLLWKKGRWALPGTCVGWAGNYSFLYLSATLMGLAAAAEINAARLLLVPMSLLVVAWGRVARPQASRLILEHDWKKLDKLAIQSFLGIELCAIVYILPLLLALPWLQTHLLGEKYLEVAPLVWGWSLYFVINGARTICTTWLVSLGMFRFLFFQGCADLVIMLLISFLAITQWGTLGAIVSLCVIEVIDLGIGLWVISKHRRTAGVPT